MPRRACLLIALLLTSCEAAPPCDPAVPPEQQLRLLSPREYDATVRDLLPEIAGDADCDTDGDCEVGSQSCTGGVCVADPCELVSFLYPADAPLGEVVVAGSFNDWGPTAADGGWALEWVPEEGAYVGKEVVADGTWEYKLVLDGGTWIPDPANPTVTDDGFGGVNSVLVQDCAGAAPPSGPGGFAPTAGFLPATRPEGYAWDNHAGGLVTSVHVEQYLAAGEALAARADLPSGDVEAWLRDFGRRAFRRPLTDAEVGRYLAVGDPAAVLQVLLSSPHFLYRSEIGEPAGEAGTFRLTPFETAAALAYLLWGTTPDDALLDAAAAGRLSDADGIEAEARRLLDDPRARDHLGTFAEQWLGADRLATADRAAALYPEWDDALAAEMVGETRAFAVAQTLDGGTYETLLTGDSARHATGTLAQLYALDGGPRAGILGQAGWLAAHSHSDQTSPIRRGLFVRRQLLCHYLPPPPPDAGGVPEVDPEATTQERFAQHTSVESCAGCHRYIDPIGLGLEHFDAIGGWRDTENGRPIDASGAVTDVEQVGDETSATFAGLDELGAILAASEAGPACYAEQWQRYAAGREAAPGASCLAQAWAETGHDLRDLLLLIVRDDAFVLRRSP